ncbi:MAG: hypothetical protein MUQ57_02320 [Porticoccus sp.]|nr:hypothetical protein [Porticoccus sp.]
MSDFNQQLIVQRHHPGRRRVEMLIWISLAVLLFLLGLLLGYRFFGTEMVEKRHQQNELENLQLQAVGMEQKLTNSVLASKIDRMALEEVRQVVTSLQTELAVDKEELGLYRNLLQTEGREKGLLIGELMLKPVSDSQQGVAYRLVVQQKEAKLKRIKVNITMTLKGLKDGKEELLGLELIDTQVESSPISAEFKYFHILEGAVELPVGFSPQTLAVEIWKKGVSSSRVERSFDWDVE